MKSNFDFLKNIDSELFEIIEDAQKLFRDEYFNQCVVQLRIFAEKTAKKVLGGLSSDLTFDDVINCLKDKAKSEVENEFINDLYFIKKEGNKCAHGEDTTATNALEAVERAFEIAINYSRAKKKTDKFDSLTFDKTLLITGKEQKEVKLVDKYIERANEALKEKEALLNSKQGEFRAKTVKDENGFQDKNRVVDAVQYSKTEEKKKKGRKKKEFTAKELEIKQKVKSKVKEAKKNLKQNINKTEKPKKESKSKNKQKEPNFKFLRMLLFVLFLSACIYFLCKMIFIF